MKIKLTKQYKHHAKGTELEVTNDLGKYLKENGFLAAKKNTKEQQEVKEI
jgi:hypothetical protein